MSKSFSAAVPAARTWTTADFDFALPPELIAQHPLPERSASRLLDGRGPTPQDRIFRDLPDLLQPGDLLVFNDTQVIKARLFGRKASGGAVELLVERVLPDGTVWGHLRASKTPATGSRLAMAEGAFEAEVLGRCGPQDTLFHLRFASAPTSHLSGEPQAASATTLALLEAHGHVPLPPYITHADTAEDAQRYQTVFATRPGAVAAPTAALHFDDGVLQGLAARGVLSARVTLHVGAGTFQLVRVDDPAQHRMHSEWYEVTAETVHAIERTRAAGGRIVAVGTTSVRSLESAAASGQLRPSTGDTDIFITPGYRFRVVDLLITNFHLPRSTLMMLVSAFAGHEHVMALYAHAVDQRYRFFSYGDSMLLHRA